VNETFLARVELIFAGSKFLGPCILELWYSSSEQMVNLSFDSTDISIPSIDVSDWWPRVAVNGRRVRGLAVCLLFVASVGVARAFPYDDVPEGHWARGAVERFTEAGGMGTAEGKFGGETELTRFQMAVLAAKLLDAIEKGSAGEADASRQGAVSGEGIEALRSRMEEAKDRLRELRTRIGRIEAEVGRLAAERARE